MGRQKESAIISFNMTIGQRKGEKTQQMQELIDDDKIEFRR